MTGAGVVHDESDSQAPLHAYLLPRNAFIRLGYPQIRMSTSNNVRTAEEPGLNYWPSGDQCDHMLWALNFFHTRSGHYPRSWQLSW